MKFSTKSMRSRIIRHLREWHRRLGIITAFFLIFLSISGIALNHTSLFSLSHQSITSLWLLEHYGIKPPSDVRFYQQKKWTVTDQFVWLNNKVVFESDDEIISIASFKHYSLVVTSTQLVIFTQAGEMVDKLDSSSNLPVPITALSITGSHIILNTTNGYYQGESDFLDWQAMQTFVEPSWIINEPASQTELKRAQMQFQSQFLNWERVILDAHSGRLFGDFGVLFMDAVAIILILLSLSGIYIWLRYARKKR
jgi:hypothetical protein